MSETAAMFETAAIVKLRIPFKGSIMPEDLFDLSEEDLDGIYRSLKSKAKAGMEDSLIDNKKSREDRILELQISIVKHVFEIKQKEKQKRIALKKKRDSKNALLDLIERKKNAELEGKSLEELEAMYRDEDTGEEEDSLI